MTLTWSSLTSNPLKINLRLYEQRTISLMCYWDDHNT